MEFGKLCSWEKQGNRVVFQFEKRTGRVEILTPEIFNVFSGVVSEEHRSKAIEGDKSVAVDFTAAEADGVVEISTDAVTARIYDDFKVDFYKADGTVLCRDYRGSRKICAGLSDELKALKEAEAKLDARLVEQDRYFANPENKAKWEKERQDNLVNERFCW